MGSLMPTGNRQDNSTLDCPSCGAENYGSASFCIACGEPFDAPGDPDLDLIFPDDKPTTKADHSEPAVKKPAPASLRRKLARRETFIGLVLIALVVGYAIFNWQHTVEQTAAYKEGAAAEQARSWDKAADAFARAGDQRDAAAKASHARVQVAERDRLYNDALDAADHQDWKAAVPALEGIQVIQPDFADSAARLVQARSQAFQLELNDLVYLVTYGPGAGLYVLDNDNRPYRLPGSDGQSGVRAMSPDGTRFVYDRPKAYTDYPVSGTGSGS